MSETELDATCVWIFDGAPNAPTLPLAEALPTCVIAADNGLTHALALGFVPAVLVGDFDSVSPATIKQWQDRWSENQPAQPPPLIERHQSDKDESDLELALQFASQLNPQRVVVLSGGAGRLDHLLISTLGLALWANAGLAVSAYVGSSFVQPIAQGNTQQLDLAPDSVLTLLAVGGPANVRTSGLRWNLSLDQTLAPGSSRGLSNEPDSNERGVTRGNGQEQPTVHVAAGTVLAIVSPTSPGHDDPSATDPGTPGPGAGNQRATGPLSADQ